MREITNESIDEFSDYVTDKIHNGLMHSGSYNSLDGKTHCMIGYMHVFFGNLGIVVGAVPPREWCTIVTLNDLKQDYKGARDSAVLLLRKYINPNYQP